MARSLLSLAFCLALLALPLLAQGTAAGGAAVLIERENVVDAQVGRLAWRAADLGTSLSKRDKLRTGEFSRAAVRFTDLTVLRVNELTTIEISPPAPQAKRVLDVKQGGIYFFSREKSPELEIRTPSVNGAMRGTECAVNVRGKKTTVTMFEGAIELRNPHGSVLLSNGEQGEAEIGQAPRKTAVIEAENIIQWCLYYPGVIDPAELALGGNEERVMADSLAAYRTGDLPGALEAHPLLRGGGSGAARIFRAAVMLSTGQVDKARAALSGVPSNHPCRLALEQMIAAVKLEKWERAGEPRTASEWMAESYYRQSRSDLEGALRAAKKAAELSPDFGFAWTRVAELEFSFGRTMRAMKVLERGLELAPHNAQAHALQGFLLSSQNRIGAARRSFEQAIALDGALGNAWLGRGLTFIRQGDEAAGRRDLQVAAVLEPNRSILRSYLGKALSQEGIKAKANVELARAKELDPNDPTPWLYSAIQRKQENRYNEAVSDLEKSIELNENRSVFRSQFLLDQDRAIRGANLAAIYENNGMVEQSVREAVRAVGSDYASAPAHLFLANSYNALRDPSRILLRYETAWFNELLLSNLLAPVGGGPLSQFVSEQEYSKMFEKDGLGISSITEYFSHGAVRQTGSQFGTFGNISYALDAEYHYDNGWRPNNELSRLETYATFKLQLGPQDTIFFQTKYQDFESGDLFQRYDQREVETTTGIVLDPELGFILGTVPNRAAQTFEFRERQDPGLLLLGWHHEWNPGNHTMLLLGRLENRQRLTAEDTTQTVLIRDVTLLAPPGLDVAVGDTIPRDAALFSFLEQFLGRGPITKIGSGGFDFEYAAEFETYSAELQQIVTLGPDTIIAGARFQGGEFETHVRLTDFQNGLDPETGALFPIPPARQDYAVDFERLNLYLYNIWHVTPWLSITGGVTYDSLNYPENFRNPPINGNETSADEVSPKVGLTLQPWRGATIRAAYAEAISGSSFDESVRLEPTQVAGFLQAYRSMLSESLVGSVAGSEYKLSGISLEQKLPTRTYLGVEYNVLEQDLDRTVGVFEMLADFGVPLAILPSSLEEKDHYREDAITATLNQLVDENWAFGARYRYTLSKFRRQLAGFSDALAGIVDTTAIDDLARRGDSTEEAGLHQLSLYALYNHPSGFFARAEANWYQQQNDATVTTAAALPVDPGFLEAPRLRTQNLGLPGDEFWQFNVLGGFRFYRNQCELSCGVLNLTDQDYRLNPLNPYVELPRERTFVVRCKLTF